MEIYLLNSTTNLVNPSLGLPSLISLIGPDPRRARGQDGGARLELPHPERKGDVRAPYAG